MEEEKRKFVENMLESAKVQKKETKPNSPLDVDEQEVEEVMKGIREKTKVAKLD